MDRYWKGPLPEPSLRTVGDMACVLADPDAVEMDPDTPLYYMYRDLAMTEKDRAYLRSQDVRYDITVIPPLDPALLGGEFVKTKGHYHPDIPSCPGISYPELYQVLAGEARFLLQRKDLSDVVAVTASAGECVLIPPGYGHVTVNAGTEVLVMVNLVSTRFESEYELYEEMRGGAFYAMVETEDGEFFKEGDFNINRNFYRKQWVRNPCFQEILSIQEISAQDLPELGFRHGSPIYDFVSGSTDLSFFNEPENNLDWC